MSLLTRPLALLFALALVALAAPSAGFASELKVEKVAAKTYALVGSINARTYENHALNSTMGFIITKKGVILIDSGASSRGAALIAKTIASVTDQPVKWVINPGSQDHRWLGNGYFAARGAQIIALARTVKSQREEAAFEMKRLGRLLKDRLADTKPFYAPSPLQSDDEKLTLGGVRLEIIWPGGAHFPNDAIVWAPELKTVFAGDLVFMDRMLGVQPGGRSNTANWAAAFHKMERLAPEHVVPGHGAPGDLAKARRDTGDYLDWLLKNIRPAVEEMEGIGDLVKRLSQAPSFRHLKHFDGWHKANVNRTYIQLESE